MQFDNTLTLTEAEIITGLDSREIMRPAHESDCGEDVYPLDPVLRFQLGRKTIERRSQHKTENRHAMQNVPVEIFTLVSFGESPAAAVARWKRNQKGAQ